MPVAAVADGTGAAVAGGETLESPADRGWPRGYKMPSGAQVVLYQPQVASWDDRKHMVAYTAEMSKQKSGKPVELTIARKNEIVEQIRRAENVPRPTELAHRAIHSPDGFEWGYAGSGPADLAFSILLSEIGEPPTFTGWFQTD